MDTIDTGPAYAALDVIRARHLGGHSHTDGPGLSRWYNPRVRPAEPCPTLTDLDTIHATIAALTARIHAAADDQATVRAVADGMTGLTMADLGDEEREGWEATARMAILSLAARLDGDVYTPCEWCADPVTTDPGCDHCVTLCPDHRPESCDACINADASRAAAADGRS